MKNSTTITLAITICVISFAEAMLAKTQISVFAAEILFIVTGFTAFIGMIQNKRTLQPVKSK